MILLEVQIAMVRMCVESRRWLNCRNRADVDCDPPSVVIVDGTPNIDIQDSTSALATDSDEVSRVKRLIHVRMCVKWFARKEETYYIHMDMPKTIIRQKK